MVVAFADKFDDNKVSRWRQHYVDYDKLIGIVPRQKKAGAAYENLARARPDIAAEVELTAEGTSNIDLGSSSVVVGDDRNEQTEGKELLPMKRNATGGYGSSGDIEGGDREAFKQKLAKRRKDIDAIKASFNAQLLAERDKASKFYVGEVELIEKRLELLIKTVQSNYELKPDPEKRRKRRDNMVLVKSVRTLIAEKNNVTDVIIDDEDDINEHAISVRKVLNETESVKRALVDLHRQTMLLRNFFVMNFTALVEVVKRFNAAFPRREVDVRMPGDYDGRLATGLGDRIVKIYAKWFTSGDVRQANAQLIIKKDDGLDMDWSQLRFGCRLGICLTLMVWLCYDCIWNLYAEGAVTPGGRSAFPVFRACGGLLIWHWCWGASVFTWRRYRINYIYLFDFNPIVVLDPAAIFNACVDETLVFLITLLLYYKASTNTMPDPFVPGLYPAFLVLYTVVKFIFPLKQRRPLWSAIIKVWTAPLTSPSFFHTYVADVFTSMVKVFLDLLWTLCFIFSGDFLIPDTVDAGDNRHEWQRSKWYKQYLVPIICLFPLYIRLMQCLRKFSDTGERVPNLPNAFKYTMSQVVTLFGAFFPVLYLRCTKDSGCGHISAFQIVWLAIFVFSSLYSWVWDVVMDWGLGRPEYGWLGPRLMFPSTFHYYGVIFADLILRFMWMQSLVPPSSGAHFELPAYLTFLNMTLELIRRTLWSFFRLENQHRTSTKHYAEHEHIEFVPLHFTTGHNHKYKQDKGRSGRRVLVEVLAVGFAVVVVCMLVVIAAQRANKQE